MANVNDNILKLFFAREHELSVENNCLLLGNKIVIPKSLQNEVLSLFHEYMYCTNKETQNFSNNSTLLSWPTAPHVFYRINIDFFYKYNHTFLIVIDSTSKWMAVKLMDRGSTANKTILKLKEIFAVYGLPVELVSDNGPPFNSSEFNAFCQANGIKLIKSPSPSE